jgi:hypothetical protein
VGAFVFFVGSTTFGRRYMWELWYILLARLNCIMVENLEP